MIGEWCPDMYRGVNGEEEKKRRGDDGNAGNEVGADHDPPDNGMKGEWRGADHDPRDTPFTIRAKPRSA